VRNKERLQLALVQWFQYDPKRKQQSLQWKQPTSPQPKKPCMSKSQMKKTPVTAYDIKDIIHFQFIPPGQTVNQAYYVEIVKWLREAVHAQKKA